MKFSRTTIIVIILGVTTLLLGVLAVKNYCVQKEIEVQPIRKARSQAANILRRAKYEYNEERYLMAADIDLTQIQSSADIKITYGQAKNREKIDYWRNVDSVRYEQDNAITSKNYHPYCDDSINCGICCFDASYIELYLASKRDVQKMRLH